MARRPLPMKPWHMYDLPSYIASKVSGCEKPFPFTAYGKTSKDAMEVFKAGHSGNFVLVSDSDDVEIPVGIDSHGNWFEINVSLV